MNLIDLQTFLSVVDTGSFTAAANALGLPKSTVSRRVSRLEDALGVDLLQRKARSFTITPHGHQLHRRCSPALREVADAERSLADAAAEPAGLLRITAPNDFGATMLFGDLMTGFGQRWPKIRFEVELSSRRVDLIGEGFDVALRASSLAQHPDTTTLMSKSLAPSTAALFANRRYLAGAPPIESPGDLVAHRCLGLTQMGGSWLLQHTGTGERCEVQVELALMANDFALPLAVAARGGGLGFLPTLFARPSVERGELERVLPDWNWSVRGFHLMWPASRHVAPRVRAFVDYATEHLNAVIGRSHAPHRS